MANEEDSAVANVFVEILNKAATKKTKSALTTTENKFTSTENKTSRTGKEKKGKEKKGKKVRFSFPLTNAAPPKNPRKRSSLLPLTSSFPLTSFPLTRLARSILRPSKYTQQ